MIIYIDESGDLGLKNNRGTKELIFTALISTNTHFKKHIKNVIQKTLNHKTAKGLSELKGHATSLNTKKYFYKKLNEFPGHWEIITTITKKDLARKASRNDFYSDALTSLINSIIFNSNESIISIVIDKNLPKTHENQIIKNIKKHLISLGFNNNVITTFDHSCNDPGLQAVDQFCTGLSRKYRLKDLEWYSIFAKKIKKELIRNYRQ